MLHLFETNRDDYRNLQLVKIQRINEHEVPKSNLQICNATPTPNTQVKFRMVGQKDDNRQQSRIAAAK